MIAKNNRILTEASESLYILNADEMERARCRAREEYILHENALNRKIAKLSGENKALSSENERLRAELAKYKQL